MKIPKDNNTNPERGASASGKNARFPSSKKSTLEALLAEAGSALDREIDTRGAEGPEIREVAKFPNTPFLQFIREAAGKAEKSSLESEELAFSEFDKFVDMCYPHEVDYIEEATNYLKALLNSNGVDFRTEVKKRYSDLSYRTGSPKDCAKKSIYAKMLLLESPHIHPHDLTPGGLKRTIAILNKLTKSQTKLFLQSVFFDPYLSAKDLEPFINALGKITEYTYMKVDQRVNKKQKNGTSLDITGRKIVKYFDPERRVQVKDVVEVSVNEDICEVVESIISNYFKSLEALEWERECIEIDDEEMGTNLIDEPWTTSGSIELRERNCPENSHEEKLEFHKRRQEIFLTGVESKLFDLTTEELVEFYNTAVDNDIRVRIAEEIVSEAKLENRKDYAIDFLCSEIDDMERIAFDDGFLRFNLINIMVNSLTNPKNSYDVTQLMDAWIDHKDPMTRLATFKALAHENLFEHGKQSLVDAINFEIADPHKGSKIFALLCRHLRLDKDFVGSGGENYEEVFRDLLQQIPHDIKMKSIFQNLTKVKIPYDKNHDLSQDRTKKSVKDYLEYIGLNRLVVWATLDKNELIRTRSMEILELYMDKDLVPDGESQIENFIRSRDPDAEFLLVAADIISAFKRD